MDDFSALNLPEFRESSAAETERAESLLRQANLAKRRERYAEAEAGIREALHLTPSDALAIEMLGDVLQGVGRVDEAMLAYRRATLADPKRASAERKYADLLVRQQEWSVEDPEALPHRPMISTLLSCLLPGSGQILNGETTKGLLLMAGAGICLLGLIFWGGIGSAAASGVRQGRNPGVLVPLAAGGLLYLYAIADANAGARRGSGAKSEKSGWEV
jgi:tetratricopeptide (TPR) repeat protein